MRGTIRMASLALAMMIVAGVAQANPCTNNYGVVVQCNAANGNINNNSNAQQQQQQQGQQQKAYGGKATATGGSANNQNTVTNSNTVTNTNNVANSNANTATANNSGNAQSVNFDDRSAPAFSVASPAAGPCTGFSGGASFSLLGGGGGFALGTIEKDCRKDQHIIIGLSDPATHAQAAHEWYAMDADLFGHDNMDPTQPPKQTSELTTAAPTQTASAEPAPYCNANWPTVIKIAHGCN